MTTPPPVNSTWKNLKKGTIYRVWANAPDEDDKPFVVYEKISVQREFYPGPLLVRHAENDLYGIYLPKRNVIEWDGRLGPDTRFYAWARPLEMWPEKFELVE